MFFHDLAKTFHGLILSLSSQRKSLNKSNDCALQSSLYFQPWPMPDQPTNFPFPQHLPPYLLINPFSIHCCSSFPVQSVKLKVIWQNAQKSKSGCLHSPCSSKEQWDFTQIAFPLDFFICKIMRPDSMILYYLLPTKPKSSIHSDQCETQKRLSMKVK